MASTESLTSPPVVSIASNLNVGMIRFQNRGLCFVFQDRFADDFLNRRGAVVDGAEAGFAECAHAEFAAGVAELVGGGAGGDQVANFVIDQNQLVDAGAAAEARVVAAVAAAA